jgi:diguanylate cyclase (GGDEF)-like protein
MLRVLRSTNWLSLTHVHRDQLASLARATPSAMAGYAINVAFAVFAFRNEIPHLELAAWALFALAVCAAVGVRSIRPQHRKSPHPAARTPLKDARSAWLFGFLLGLPWTILTTRWAGDLHTSSELVLIALAVGMAASGAILTAPIPAVAVTYATTILLPLALKCMVVLGNDYIDLGALALSFLIFLYGLIATAGRLFLERLAAVTQLQETIAALSEAHEETERVAMTDGLTGIANRRAFIAKLNSLSNGRPVVRGYSIFYIDLDRFKAVNDALGHAVGDALLKTVAVRIGNLVRQGDLVARLGGDEFAVIANDICERGPASALAERLVMSLAEPYNLEGQKLHIGASIGVALASESTIGGEMLLKQSDLAMYAAKGTGRGTYCIFEADMQRSADERRVLELGLRAALMNDGFELYYQPIRRLDTGEITGFECQLRWRHPLRGLLSPSQFLSVATDIGIAEDIGSWVMTEACRQAAQWPSSISVSINLSSLQIGPESVAAIVKKALNVTGLPAQRLELEIEVTESSLMQIDPGAIDSLRQLNHMGVSIALDDFGTGYSSLSYLIKFPFNRIKIDRLFVSQLGRSAQSDLIVCSIARLAQSMNCSVVAEGIETVEQHSRLRALEISHGQGPRIGLPLSAAEAIALLADTELDLTCSA